MIDKTFAFRRIFLTLIRTYVDIDSQIVQTKLPIFIAQILTANIECYQCFCDIAFV